MVFWWAQEDSTWVTWDFPAQFVKSWLQCIGLYIDISILYFTYMYIYIYMRKEFRTVSDAFWALNPAGRDPRRCSRVQPGQKRGASSQSPSTPRPRNTYDITTATTLKYVAGQTTRPRRSYEKIVRIFKSSYCMFKWIGFRMLDGRVKQNHSGGSLKKNTCSYIKQSVYNH